MYTKYWLNPPLSKLTPNTHGRFCPPPPPYYPGYAYYSDVVKPKKSDENVSRCHILPKSLMDLRWVRTRTYQQKNKKRQRTVTVISVISDEQLPELLKHLSVANQTAADIAHARQGAVRRGERN